MSKEAVRQLVTKRFASFTFEGIDKTRKSYPNITDRAVPPNGRWIRLHNIQFILHKVTSIGSEPCTMRTGVIIIDAFERLDSGTKRIFELTDAIEEWFGLWDAGRLWTSPANTVNFPEEGNKNAHYRSRVYIPFTYDQGFKSTTEIVGDLEVATDIQGFKAALDDALR